jgi:hypothetical protein
MRWKATIRGYFFIHTAVTPQIDKTGAQGEYNSAHMHPTTIITPPPPLPAVCFPTQKSGMGSLSGESEGCVG